MKAKVQHKKAVAGVTFSTPVKEAEDRVKALEVVTKGILDWRRVDELKSDEEYTACTQVLTALKEQINEAEKERKAIVDPLNAVVKHVNAKFKPYTKDREALEAHLKMLLRKRLELQRAEALAAAEKEAKKAEKKGAKQLAEDIRERALSAEVVPSSANVKYRKRWTFKVTKLDKVPREFLCLDEKAVNAAIATGVREIDGLEIYEDTIVAVSA